AHHRHLHSFPTRRSSDLASLLSFLFIVVYGGVSVAVAQFWNLDWFPLALSVATLLLALVLYSYWSRRAVNYLRDHLEEMTTELRSEEHTSELQSPCNLVC